MKIEDLIYIDKDNNGSVIAYYKWDEIESIPEFAKLKECEQNPKWHSEGNAFEHTKLVCKAAEDMLYKFDNIYDKTLLLASALFHDIGKGTCTKLGKDGNWHSYGHEIEGEKITRKLLWDEAIQKREDICSLVRWHMEPTMITKHKDVLSSIFNIGLKVPSWPLLIALKECDIRGQKRDEETKDSAFNETASLHYLKRVVSDKNKYNYIYINNNMTYMKESINGKSRATVYMLIGLPGSGKSTYAERIKDCCPDSVILSRDSIRAELGFCEDGEKVVCSTEQENEVTKVFNQKMIDAIKNNKIAIIDNINLKKKYRDSYKNLLKDYNVDWQYVYFQASSIEENIKRRDGQINKEVLYNMMESLDYPTPDEYTSLSIITI